MPTTNTPTLYISESATIHAAPSAVYALLCDYRVGHPSILPKPYFQELVVEAGGTGAGTIFNMTMLMFGKKFYSRMEVSEPEPGRVLQEVDQLSGTVTQFTLEPTAANHTTLTISTTLPIHGGLVGIIERAFTPKTLRTIYHKQFACINDHFNHR